MMDRLPRQYRPEPISGPNCIYSVSWSYDFILGALITPSATLVSATFEAAYKASEPDVAAIVRETTRLMDGRLPSSRGFEILLDMSTQT